MWPPTRKTIYSQEQSNYLRFWSRNIQNKRNEILFGNDFYEGKFFEIIKGDESWLSLIEKKKRKILRHKINHNQDLSCFHVTNLNCQDLFDFLLIINQCITEISHGPGCLEAHHISRRGNTLQNSFTSIYNKRNILR